MSRFFDMAIEAVEGMPSELPEDVRERVNQLDVGPVHLVALELYESNAAPEVWERKLRDALRVLDETAAAVRGTVEGFDFRVRDRIHIATCAHDAYTRGCTSCAVRYTLHVCREAAVSGFESLGTRMAEASLQTSVRGRLGPAAKKKANPVPLAVEALAADTYAEFMARKERGQDAIGFLLEKLERLVDERALGDGFSMIERGDASWDEDKSRGHGSFSLVRENGSDRKLSVRSLLEQLKAKKK